MKSRFAMLAAVVAAMAGAAWAAEPKFGAPVPLFNGKDLSGWAFSGDAVKAAWSVKDGVMHNAGKPGGYIRTEKTYTNFKISLEFRHLSKGNGGVLLRAQAPDKVWPRSIECQGMVANVGDIWNIDQFPMKTDPARTGGRRTQKLAASNEKPMGEWNTYEIVLNRGDLEIRVNGLLQNSATECWETPGWICLQSEGAEMEFRNLVLTPIE